MLLRSDLKLTHNLMSKYIIDNSIFFYIYFVRQNIAISTNKPEHVTATGDPSSTYLTDNYEAQGLM